MREMPRKKGTFADSLDPTLIHLSLKSNITKLKVFKAITSIIMSDIFKFENSFGFSNERR